MSVHEQDIEVVDGEVVPETTLTLVPYSPGEVLDLASMPIEEIARVMDEAKEFAMVQLREFQRELQAEVLRRMDAAAAAGEDGAWTIHAPGGYKLEGDSPDRSEYPVDELRKVLGQLAAAGEIESGTCEHCGAPTGVISKVIVPNGWKVAKRALDQQIKRGGLVKDAIESVKQTIARRSVRVSREVR